MYKWHRGKRIPTRFIRNATPYYDNGRNSRYYRNNYNNRGRKRFQQQNADRDYRTYDNFFENNEAAVFTQNDINNDLNNGFNQGFNADKPLLVNFFPDENSREIVLQKQEVELDPWDLRNRISQRNKPRRKLQYQSEELDHENEENTTNEVYVPEVEEPWEEPEEPRQERSHVAPVWSRISPPKTENEAIDEDILSSFVVIDEVYSDDFIPPIDQNIWDIPTPGITRTVTTASAYSAPVQEPQESFNNSLKIWDIPTPGITRTVTTSDYSEPVQQEPLECFNNSCALASPSVTDVNTLISSPSADHDDSVIFVGYGTSSASHETSGNSNFAEETVENVAEGDKAIPEVAANPEPVKVYAVSAAEAKDNCDPEWEVLKLLQTDDERYRAVRKRWKSVEVPDPFRNLTHHGYRQARCPARPGGHKRTMSQADPSAGNYHEQRPAKRQRIVGSCVDIFDTKLRAEEQSFQQTAQNLLSEQHKNVIHLTRSRQMPAWNPFMYSPDTVVRQEIHKCVSFYQSQIEMARAKHEEKMAKLSDHRQEVLQFYQFYSNLKNSGDETRNSVLLNEQQLQAIEETDYMHSLYETYYR